jgi:two-component system, LytTR family, response regulator
MRSVLIDDEASNRENLQGLLKKYCPEVVVLAEAESIEQGVSIIKQYQPDLVFLDIRLHGGSGFDLLQQLDEIHFEIVFITAYDKYGIQAVKFAALDYLLKPVDIEELKTAVAKAHARIGQKKKNERLGYLLEHLSHKPDQPAKIALPLLNETMYVSVADIIRCEASNTYTNFFLASGEKLLVSQTLKEYDRLLTRHGFIRTHQSHLVNTTYVRSWLKEDGGVLLLRDQSKIPVSKLNRQKVKSALSYQ